MLQERDWRVINFLERFGAATTGQIKELYFPAVSFVRARDCLRRIVKESAFVQLDKEMLRENVFYIGKKTQVKHKLVVTEFFRRLFTGPGTLIRFEPEHTIDRVRADAYVEYLYNGYDYRFMVEVQLSASKPDYDKYIRLFRSREWDIIPRIVLISDRRWALHPELDIVRIPSSCDGWETILR